VLHRIFRRALASVAAVLSLAAQAQNEVTIPLGPLEDPDITRHIAGISAPHRKVQLPVLVRGGRDTAPRVVEIIGPLTGDDLEMLVRLTGLYSQGLNRIIGDSMFATAHAGASCGRGCTRDVQLTFRRDASIWKFLYKID
jgi:hypothetical protein